MLKLFNVSKTFNRGTITEKVALKNINLEIDDGDFITVIGGNGAGKSTLLNLIAGIHFTDTGSLFLDGMDLTGMPEYVRAKYLGRVFQDPMMGTAANMQIQENLALAMRRGKRRTLSWGVQPAERALYREKLALLGAYAAHGDAAKTETAFARRTHGRPRSENRKKSARFDGNLCHRRRTDDLYGDAQYERCDTLRQPPHHDE